jgi:hypothetical protein
MVRAKVAVEVIGRIDEGEPKAEGEDGSDSSDENT